MRRHLLASLGLSAVLALTVVGCGGGATPTPGPATAPPAAESPAGASPAGSGDAVTIADFAFDPAALKAKVGATVAWTNRDSATHTVVWDDGTEGSGSLADGSAPYTRTFDTPGTFAYHCGIHAAMKGTVVVEP